MDDTKKRRTLTRRRLGRFFGNKKAVIGASAIAVVVIGVLIWAYLLSIKTSPLVTDTKPIDTGATQSLVDVTSKQAQAVVDSGGSSDSAGLIYDQAVNKTTDSYQKTVLLCSKAMIYFEDNDYDTALTIARQAEAIDQNVEVESFIARVYQAKGDTKNAADYYNKSVVILRQAQPLDAGRVQYYQVLIKQLGGSVN